MQTVVSLVHVGGHPPNTSMPGKQLLRAKVFWTFEIMCINYRYEKPAGLCLAVREEEVSLADDRHPWGLGSFISLLQVVFFLLSLHRRAPLRATYARTAISLFRPTVGPGFFRTHRFRNPKCRSTDAFRIGQEICLIRVSDLEIDPAWGRSQLFWALSLLLFGTEPNPYVMWVLFSIRFLKFIWESLRSCDFEFW